MPFKDTIEKKSDVGLKISRREFLGLAGKVIKMTIICGLLGGDTYATKPETGVLLENELKPSARVLDFFNIDVFSGENSLEEMGVSDPSTRKGLLEAVPKNEEQIRLLMKEFFIHQYQDHGKNVVAVMEKVSGLVSPNQKTVTPARVSIANAVKFGKIEYDEMGNPTIHVVVDPEVIDRLVSDTTASVVNMSFEPGNFSLTYFLYGKKLRYPDMGRQIPSKMTIDGTTKYKNHSGNEITKEQYNDILKEINETEVVLYDPNERDIGFLDGYAGEATDQNLLKLVKIARKHPEKMFVAAGGNPTYSQGLKIPDIREARAKLEKQEPWPENLIIVGFQVRGPDFVSQASYGADIYVTDEDLEELGFSGASSYATPVVTEIIRRLIEKGLKTHKQARNGLMALAQKAESWEGSEKYEYSLLDLNKVKETFISH